MELDELNSIGGVGNELLYKIQYCAEHNSIVVTMDDQPVETTGEAPTEDNTSEHEVFIVTGYNSGINTKDDIEVLDNEGSLLGILCLSCNDKTMPIDNMTQYRYASYVLDCESANSVGMDKSHTFKNSYLFVKKEHSNLYKERFMDSAPLWGGFTHVEKCKFYEGEPTHLYACDGLLFPTEEHKLKLNYAVLSLDGFDRYLKKYHLLELIYDYICVLKLRTMDSSIKDFRSVMMSYSREELPSLKSLLKNYIEDVDSIIDVIYMVRDHKDISYKIFQEYSRESNPLKDSSNWNSFWECLESEKLSFENSRNNKFGKYNNKQEHTILVLNIVSYWIYRIRCSIAHNKIGEFIFNSEDEKFVVEVGEKIIDRVIKKVYSNENLKVLIDRSKKIDECLETIEN